MGKIPKSIKKYIPDYEYILYDLSPYGDEEIKGDAKLRIFLEIIKAISIEDLDKFMETLARAFSALEELDKQKKGIDYFETFVRYIMNARKDIKLSDVYEVVKNISLERSEEIMTIAEQLIKEGMELGIEKGIDKGIEKGILEGKRKAAKNFLKLGLSAEQVAEAAELTIDEVTKLKKEIEN